MLALGLDPLLLLALRLPPLLLKLAQVTELLMLNACRLGGAKWGSCKDEREERLKV